MQILRINGQGPAVIEANGAYRIHFDNEGKGDFTAIWAGGETTRAGLLTCSVDGNPGLTPVTLNLAVNDNAFAWTVCVPCVDVAVADLPPGGRVLFYCNKKG